MADKIPIDATHARAREILEAAHAIDYEDSMLGAKTRAQCACGWTSPWSFAGWIAQEVAGRHRVAFIEHPLDNRNRYAIHRRACLGCEGTGLVPRSGYECPLCYGGHLWVILDRESGREGYAATQSLAITRLEDDIRFMAEEPTA